MRDARRGREHLPARYLATGSDCGRLFVYDVHTGAAVCKLEVAHRVMGSARVRARVGANPEPKPNLYPYPEPIPSPNPHLLERP